MHTENPRTTTLKKREWGLRKGSLKKGKQNNSTQIIYEKSVNSKNGTLSALWKVDTDEEEIYVAWKEMK